jgi:hypothetical protein
MYQLMPTHHGELPKFVDKTSKKIWMSSIQAYAHLQSVVMTVEEDGHKIKVWIKGDKAAQAGNGVTWGYDGKTLTLLQGGRKRKIQCKASDIPSFVGFGATENILVDWARHANPVRKLGRSGMKARMAGTAEVRGVTCNMVELNSKNLRIDALIRRKDHLLEQVISYDLRDGKVISQIERYYDYISVNKPIPSAVFHAAKPGPEKAPHKQSVKVSVE